MSEPLLGRDPLWFDSRKQPPSVSDHWSWISAFWSVALYARSTVTYVLCLLNFKHGCFAFLKSRPCPCRYLTHLHAVCRHFISLLLLFKGHVACRIFALTLVIAMIIFPIGWTVLFRTLSPLDCNWLVSLYWTHEYEHSNLQPTVSLMK